VIVTFDEEKGDLLKNFAQDYTEEINQELSRRNAPYQFHEIKHVKVSHDKDHIKAMQDTVDRPKGRWILLSYLGKSTIVNTKNYNKIRQMGSEKGWITQCITSSRASLDKKIKNKRSIVNNLMTQIINKFGHLLWHAPLSSFPESFQNKSILMIGIDVYHSKKVYQREKNKYRQRRSIGGFIASFISKNGTYKTRCDINVHVAREEIIGGGKQVKEDEKEELEGPRNTSQDALKTFVEKAIEKFGENPDIIIVYRDGVAESQIQSVRDHELPQIKQAIGKSGHDTRIIFTIIQKRIHVRFIANEDGEYKNPPPGTVVEDGTIGEGFYLIPTKCDLSTVKPVNYVLLENTTETVSLHDLQHFTYIMCHMYPNWTSSIKLPFPTQMAHKIAYTLGECKIENPVINEKLKNTLFFL